MGYKQHSIQKILKIVNAKIDNIISQVIEKYPDITEEAVLKILKNNETPESSILEKYGYTQIFHT